MNLLKLKNNQEGFSLVQVLIAFGLTTVLALQMLRMNSMQIKTSRNTELNLDISLMMNQVALYLANTESCKNTFREVYLGAPYEYPTGSGIRNRTNSLVYSVGEKYSRDRLEITSIKVVPTVEDPIDPPADKFGVVDVKLQLKKLKGGDNSLTTESITKTVTVQILSDDDGLVERCYSLSDESSLSLRSQTCELDLGGTWNQERGRCEGIDLGQGNICGTCMYVQTFPYEYSHKIIHGMKVADSKKSKKSPDSSTRLSMKCESLLSCQGKNICANSDDNSWCVPNCPPGYSLRGIYEDDDIEDETFTKAILKKTLLMTCIKT